MPTTPTTITTLPTPPTRADPANFATRGDALLGALPTFVSELIALAANVYANAVEVASNALAAVQARTICEAAATNSAVLGAAANATAAAAAAAAASASAALAQSVSPDSPVRLNTRVITADLTIPSAYNAASIGPIQVADGVTATVQPNATWSIQ
jgi:hypothetical protein